MPAMATVHGPRTWQIALAASLVFSCARTATSSPPSPRPSLASPAAAAASADDEVDVPVIVDGRALGVLRHAELPPGPLEVDGATHFHFDRYLIALGLPPSSRTIELVDLDGRTRRLEPTVGASVTFGFHQEHSGNVRLFVNGLETTRVAAVRIASTQKAPQEKEPADDDRSALGRGTRIYVDGRLLGWVKRRALFGPKVEGREDGDRETTLGTLLESFAVRLAEITSLEVVSGDAVVGRAEGASRELAAKLRVVVPAHGHGRVRLDLPAPWSAGGVKPTRRPLVSALLLGRGISLRPQPLVAVTDETERRAARGLEGRRSDHDKAP